jgi:hypothetical protein
MRQKRRPQRLDIHEERATEDLMSRVTKAGNIQALGVPVKKRHDCSNKSSQHANDKMPTGSPVAILVILGTWCSINSPEEGERKGVAS